jgi:hypothetical protein
MNSRSTPVPAVWYWISLKTTVLSSTQRGSSGSMAAPNLRQPLKAELLRVLVDVPMRVRFMTLLLLRLGDDKKPTSRLFGR